MTGILHGKNCLFIARLEPLIELRNYTVPPFKVHWRYSSDFQQNRAVLKIPRGKPRGMRSLCMFQIGKTTSNPYLPVAVDDELLRRQFLEAHRPEGVYLRSRYTYLRAEPELETIGETR